MAWTSNIDLIQKLYIAFYGRPADPGGLRYWASQLPDNSTANSAATRELISRFINSQEAQDRFGSPSLDSAIARIYTYAFHRDATNADKALYTGKTVVDVLVNVISVSSGPDYASLNNKLEYAKWFTAFLDPNGDGLPNDDSTGTKFYATFYGNTDATDIAAKLNLIDAANPAVKSNVLNDVISIADPGDEIKTNPPSTGQTFTLTDKLDIFTNVGSGTVNAVISSTAGETTWQVADQISGGTAGSTLNLTAVVGGNISTAGRSTSGIENFNITFADNDTNNNHTLTVDASTLTGAKNFTIVSATASNGDKVAFTGLAKSQNVTIKSADSDLNVELSYKSGEDSGASDVAALAVDGAKVGTVTVNGDFETVKVTGTGTSSVSTLNAAGNKMTKLEIAGAGATTLSSVTGFDTAASKLTIDASAATGNVTVGVALSDKFDIKGGSGSDTIIATNTTGVNISSSFKSTGVETILFKENGTSSALTHTINLTNATGVTTVGLRGSASSNADTVTFNNVADNITVLLQGDKTAANQTLGSVAVAVKNATASAPANAVTIKVNNQGQDTGMTGSTENTIAVGTVTANNVKNITIDAADGDVSAFTLAANGLVSLTVKATEDFVFSSAVGAATKTTTIDASQVAGKAEFTLTNNLEKDVTVTTGAGKDKVTLGDQTQNTSSSDNTITINLGDGDDTFVTGSVANKSVLKVDLGAGNDTVEVTNNKNITSAKSHSIDFGDGIDTLKFQGSNNTDISTVTLDNLEKVLLTGAGDLSVQAASFSGKSIEIITIGSGRLQLVGTDGADTIDASTLNIVGPNGVKIKGGQGNDTITLKSGAVDRVVFEATAAANGEDIINNFTTGITNGDILDFSAFTSAAGALDNTVYTSNPSSPVTLTNNSAVRLVDIPGGQDITTAAGLLAALNTGGEYANIDGTNSGDRIIFLTASSATATTFKVFYAIVGSTPTEFASVTLVGTVNASGALGTLVGANFDLS